jgi:hypothetical protein
MQPFLYKPLHQRVIRTLTSLAFFALLLILLACQPEDQIEQTTPTPIPPTGSVTATLEAGLTPTVTTSPTVNLTPPSPTFPATATATLIPTDAPPTATPLPTDTPGPYVHTIRSNEDCISIIRDYGHVDLDALQVFYQLNEIVGGRCLLPPEGQTVFVPRPTLSLGDVPTDVTLTPSPTFFLPQVAPEAFFNTSTYCVVEEDTLTSVALKNNTSNRVICELNPLPDGINCTGCDFSVSDVGSCPNPPLLSVGQCLFVPAATPTPLPTLPPSGSETPTPTPTHRAPTQVYPIPQSTVTGLVRLQWTSVGLLQQDEYYVVELNDQSSGAYYINATQNTFLDVPADYQPRDGATHTIAWSVSIQRLRPDGSGYDPIGGRTLDSLFYWE